MECNNVHDYAREFNESYSSVYYLSDWFYKSIYYVYRYVDGADSGSVLHQWDSCITSMAVDSSSGIVQDDAAEENTIVACFDDSMSFNRICIGFDQKLPAQCDVICMITDSNQQQFLCNGWIEYKPYSIEFQTTVPVETQKIVFKLTDYPDELPLIKFFNVLE